MHLVQLSRFNNLTHRLIIERSEITTSFCYAKSSVIPVFGSEESSTRRQDRKRTSAARRHSRLPRFNRGLRLPKLNQLLGMNLSCLNRSCCNIRRKFCNHHILVSSLSCKDSIKRMSTRLILGRFVGFIKSSNALKDNKISSR